jgi:peptide/nickel transport system substrate-binding protein
MEHRDDGRALDTETPGLTRRSFVSGAAKTGMAFSSAAFLAACGSSVSSSVSSSASSSSAAATGGLAALPGGTPKRGGTFTVGVITAGSAENLFPGTLSVPPDYARQMSLYNYLFYPSDDVSSQVPGLALSAEHNHDASVWIFKLRPDVLWHDGSPFTAADVVYNFKALWSSATTNYSASFLTGVVDFKKVRARDKLTVEVPLLRPVAQFPTMFAWLNFGIVKEGATAKTAAAHPIGTGPFKFVSFTPGSQSVFEANKDYWEEGKPYVDKLIVDSSFTDNNSLTSALLGGQVNLFLSPPLATAREQIASKGMQILQAPVPSQTYMFGMRVDKGPFADNRIRTAFKLLVNRQEMINSAFAGFGDVDADLIGVPGVPYYASDLKRTPDVEKAKSMFKAAGVAGHTFAWPTAEVAPGFVESTTNLAAQAAAAGIKVAVDTVSIATYFTPAGGAYTRVASQNFWQPATSLMVDYFSSLTADAPFRDTWWGHQKGGNGVPSGASAQKLISAAIAEVNPGKAADLWHECQLQQYNYGGYLAWGNLPYVDGAAKEVRGLKAGAGMNFGGMRFQDGWID